MARQHHFVIFYDEGTGNFVLDFDTQESWSNGKPIFDDSKDEWQGLGEEIEDDNSTYNRSADALYEAIKNLPLRDKE
jgi:hypothetical protein